MRNLKKFLLFLVTAVLCLQTSAAYAAQADLKPPPEQSKAYKVFGIESLQYLKEWGCDLTPYGGGYIYITGFTQAYQNVDYIKVNLYLQRWNGSNWVNLGNWLFEDRNTSLVTGEKGLQVATGYYYRVRGEHSLTNDGVTEPSKDAESYSSAIYIK
ncbi:MAG: hypothetical protein IMW94_08470 [Thermoanaerobacter sp.]|nr:hypothetical protein [Thermoanaerobacter sp.]